MVAGIAHEVNTPIGLGVTASTLLADRLKEIKQSFEEKTLKSSQLKKFLNEGEENIGIIYRNLERAAKLISSFKKVAVDQSSADTRHFNVSELLEEVTLTLKARINQENVKLTVDCPKDLIIESKPGPINQILINLIINSIIHGFEHKPQGVINISINYLSEQLHINYQDDGIGIDESIKSRIFDPFTTTKRGSGGSGLGLHLVFNLVTQALNGHIDFESNIGQGTVFSITFPVTLVSD
jgi:signal transduction histidine kinase